MKSHQEPEARLVKAAVEVVSATLARMPASLRHLAEGVRLHLENFPSEEIVKQGFEPDLLGLFIGDSVGAEPNYESPLPPQIYLYLESIYGFCDGDEKAFRKEVRLTYLHELGHFFGWDEEEVAARGLE